jgi:hypothetical protein
MSRTENLEPLPQRRRVQFVVPGGEGHVSFEARTKAKARRRNSLSRFLSSRIPTVAILFVATSFHECGYNASRGETA